jgi:hypothetical protein
MVAQRHRNCRNCSFDAVAALKTATKKLLS